VKRLRYAHRASARRRLLNRAASRQRANRAIAVDLFCGAGGMSLGFERAGFAVRAAVDASEINTAVHERNFPDTTTMCQRVEAVTGVALRKAAHLDGTDISVVVGGPPCQGFSIGGKGRPRDRRNRLIFEFARLVVELQPRYFVMENVAGLLQPRYSRTLERFTQVLRDNGYVTVTPMRILNAADYGVPQRRKRVFILGHREGLTAPRYPVPSDARITVGEAIDDLRCVEQAELVDGDCYAGRLGRPSMYARELRGRHGRRGSCTGRVTGFGRTDHTMQTVLRFQRVKPGGVDAVSRFIRLDRAGVAPTLRAGTGFENGRFMAPRPIHPDYPRCICLREAARLQSFPDWFQFHETKWHGFMQVGNSVPPALAYAVADEIRRAMMDGD